MRKILITILIIVLTCSLSACSKSPEEKLLSDWSNYVLAYENMHGDMQWAFDYVEAFVQEPSWKNMQLAQVALNVASQNITLEELPAESMTLDDYDVLIQKGMEVTFIQPAINSFAKSKQAILSDCQVQQVTLSNSIFYKYELTTLGTNTELMRQFYNDELCYTALSTNYLLLDLGNNEQTKDFRTFVNENCPVIASFQSKYTDYDKTQLMAETTAVLDNTEQLTIKLSELVGMSQASLDIYNDVIGTSEEEAFLRESLLEIGDLPLVLPYPTWDDGKNAEYNIYWNEKDGSKTYPKVREELSKTPDGWVVQWKEVSKEDLLNYRNELTALGIESLNFKDNDTNCEITYEFAGSAFVLSWQEDTVQIVVSKKPICFAPSWYISMFPINSGN